MYRRNDEMLKMGLERKLIYAVATNNLETIKSRLTSISRRQLDIKYPTFDNALLLTANDNNIEAAQLLLDAGANTEIKDTIGCTSLAIALKKGHEELAYLLMKYGANICHESSRKISTLHYAAVGCGGIMIEHLLDKGLNINYLSSDNLSAIDFTTDPYSKGNVNAARALINRGMQKEIITNGFIKACWRGNNEIARLLIYAGANINLILGKNRRKPETLFWLCKLPSKQQRTKYLKTIRLLLNHGVNFDITYKFSGSILDCEGSPLQMARDQHFTDAVNLILEGEW